MKRVGVVIGTDHAALQMKNELVEHLKTQSYVAGVTDFGTFTAESVDYPDYGRLVSEEVLRRSAAKEDVLGVALCGSGIGISIACNKVAGIRCALSHDYYSAVMARKHNNANVLAIGGRSVGIEVAKQMVDVFMTTEFEGGRHERRLEKIAQLEHGSGGSC